MADSSRIVLNIKVDGIRSVDRATASMKKHGTQTVKTTKSTDRAARANKSTGASFTVLGHRIKKASSFMRVFRGNLISFTGIRFNLRNIISPFKSLLKTGAEFEQSLKNLELISGATSKQMAKMKTVIDQLGGSTSFTQTQIATTARNLASLGLSSDEIVNSLEAVVKGAGATGLSVEEMGLGIATAGNVFGIEANKMADIFVRLQNTSAATASDLTKFGKRGYLAIKGLGIPLREGATLFGELRNKGLTAKLAATAFTGVMKGLNAATSVTRKALGGINIDFQTFRDLPFVERMEMVRVGLEKIVSPAERASIATQIFGQSGINAFSNLVVEGEKFDITMKRLNDRLASSIGANEQYEKSINTVTGRSAIFGSVIEAIGNKFYNLIKGPLSSFINYATVIATSIKDMDFTPFVDGILWAASSVGPWMQYIGRIISAFVTFVKPILGTVWDGLKEGYNFIEDNAPNLAKGLAIVVTGLLAYKVAVIGMTLATGGYTIATGLATAAQAALNFAMSVNPIALALAAVAAASVGVYLYWEDITKMFEKSKVWFDQTFTGLKEQTVKIVDDMMDGITESVSGIWDAMVKPIEEAVTKVKGWFDWLKIGLLDNSPVPEMEIGIGQAFKNIGIAILDVERPIAESLAMFNRLKGGTVKAAEGTADAVEDSTKKIIDAYTQMGMTRSQVFKKFVEESVIEQSLVQKNAFAHKQYAALRIQGLELVAAAKVKETADRLKAEQDYLTKVQFYHKQAGALMQQGADQARLIKAQELADKLAAEKEYLAKVAFYNRQAGALMAQGKLMQEQELQAKIIAAHKQYGESRVAGEKLVVDQAIAAWDKMITSIQEIASRVTSVIGTAISSGKGFEEDETKAELKAQGIDPDSEEGKAALDTAKGKDTETAKNVGTVSGVVGKLAKGDFIGAGLGALMSNKTFQKVMGKIANILVKSIGPVLEALEPVFEEFVPIFELIGEMMVELAPILKELAPVFRLVLRGIKTAFGLIKPPLSLVARGLTMVAKWIAKLFGLFNALIKILKAVHNALSPSFLQFDKGGTTEGLTYAVYNTPETHIPHNASPERKKELAKEAGISGAGTSLGTLENIGSETNRLLNIIVQNTGSIGSSGGSGGGSRINTIDSFTGAVPVSPTHPSEQFNPKVG